MKGARRGQRRLCGKHREHHHHRRPTRLGITLLAFGLGYTDLIDGVTAADAVSIAHYVGGVALFIAGLFALRDRDTGDGTAFTVLGASGSPGRLGGAQVSDNAAGLFLLLFAW